MAAHHSASAVAARTRQVPAGKWGDRTQWVPCTGNAKHACAVRMYQQQDSSAAGQQRGHVRSAPTGSLHNAGASAPHPCSSQLHPAQALT